MATELDLKTFIEAERARVEFLNGEIKRYENFRDHRINAGILRIRALNAIKDAERRLAALQKSS